MRRPGLTAAAFAMAALAACGEQDTDAPQADSQAQSETETTTMQDAASPTPETAEVAATSADTQLATQRVEIERVVSPGGIEAWLVSEETVPLIAMEFGFVGGARLDPPGKEGLAYMLSGLLDEGAGELDSQAFQTRLEDLAVRLSFDASNDAFYGSLKTLTENRDAAFELMKLALSEARFDDEPVERIRNQILVRLNRDLSQPQSIASRTLFENLFPGHPYGQPLRGTPETVAALTVDDLRSYLGKYLARDNLKIAVVGDITADELAPLLDDTFGVLPPTAAPTAVSEADVPATSRLIVVEREQPQTVALFAGPGLKIDDPEFFPAYVMNYILGGGGFSSRLMEEVREKRGLAYGVSTFLLPYDYGAAFLGNVATENERIAESLDIIRAEMVRLRDEGVAAEELADAKTYLTGSFPLRFDSNTSIANTLVSYQLSDRGIDYINERNGLIEAVTADEIARVAARLLDPDALTIVVVGQPVGLAPGAAAAE